MRLFFVEDDIYENYFFIQKYASLQKYLKIKMVSFVFCPNECSLLHWWAKTKGDVLVVSISLLPLR